MGDDLTLNDWYNFLRQKFNKFKVELGDLPEEVSTSERWYIINSEELLFIDLKEDILKRGLRMVFQPSSAKGALLQLSGDGGLPYSYQTKFAAYRIYALRMGYNLSIKNTKLDNGGVAYEFQASEISL